MSVNSTTIMNELRKLPFNRGLQFKSGDAWVRCPYHKNGNEKTPSFRITLNTSKYKLGSCHCFGCGKTVEWNEFASLYGLKKFNKLYTNEPTRFITNEEKRKLFGHEEEIILDKEPWPSDVNWRGINGNLLSNIGAQIRFVERDNSSKLYLPVTIWDDLVGGVTCELKKRKGIRSYMNDEGKWPLTSLFPFDYVRKHVNPNSVIILGEGPRDALNLCQYGVPALATLGSKTIWRKEKAELILSLEPKLVVLAFDPDEAGKGGAAKAASDLKGKVPLLYLRLPPERDPGNLKEQEIEKLCQKIPMKLMK